MQIAEIRELRNAQPFRPFVMRLRDGREFFIEQPYYVGISPKQDFVLAVSATGTAWFPPEIIDEVRFPPSVPARSA